MNSFDAGNCAGKEGRHCIGMPASDPSDETGIMEMAHNATAEKSGAAKYSHTRRHDAKVSRRLRLSYSHSTADQCRHRGASQKAVRFAAPQVPLRRQTAANAATFCPQPLDSLRDRTDWRRKQSGANPRSLREGKICGEPLQTSIAVSGLNL